jgi:Domain of unknown function (DUF1905)
MKSFVVKGKVFKYPGAQGWHFIEVEKKLSEKIRKGRHETVGWKFLRIKANIGRTMWDTTLFPTKQGPYLLALKASVRKKECVFEDDTVSVRCTFV